MRILDVEMIETSSRDFSSITNREIQIKATGTQGLSLVRMVTVKTKYNTVL